VHSLFRCGFKIEGILRKHRIVKGRNRDTALYVILNSEWFELSIKLKKWIGIDPNPKTIKVADIQTGKDAIPIIKNSPSVNNSTTSSASAILAGNPKNTIGTEGKQDDKVASASTVSVGGEEQNQPGSSETKKKKKKKNVK
jgi:hypothetical protein